MTNLMCDGPNSEDDTAIIINGKLTARWNALKARVDSEMSRVKHAGMVITYNKVLHMMKELEEK
jgi:hypothetical protein